MLKDEPVQANSRSQDSQSTDRMATWSAAGLITARRQIVGSLIVLRTRAASEDSRAQRFWTITQHPSHPSRSCCQHRPPARRRNREHSADRTMRTGLQIGYCTVQTAWLAEGTRVPSSQSN